MLSAWKLIQDPVKLHTVSSATFAEKTIGNELLFITLQVRDRGRRVYSLWRCFVLQQHTLEDDDHHVYVTVFDNIAHMVHTNGGLHLHNIALLYDPMFVDEEYYARAQ